LTSMDALVQRQVLPDLSPAAELAPLARILWREGYDDHHVGHMTVRRELGLIDNVLA
jgi:hypothetical protein